MKNNIKLKTSTNIFLNDFSNNDYIFDLYSYKKNCLLPLKFQFKKVIMLSRDSIYMYESQNENSDVYCQECKHTFDDIALHKDIVHRRRNEKWCQRCGRLFSKSSHYTKHMDSDCSTNEKHRCYVCGKTDFKNTKTFSTHLEKHDCLHVHWCKKCSKCFTFRLNFEKHVALVHESNEVTNNEPLVDDVDSTTEINKSIQVLINTMDIDESKTYCTLCHHHFSNIDMHRAFVHRHEPQLLCQLCGRAFFDDDRFQHHSTKHRKQKIECYVCRRRDFESSKIFFAHLEEHEALRVYPCEFCSKTFAVRNRYEKHLKRKHGRSFVSSVLNEHSDSGNSEPHLQTSKGDFNRSTILSNNKSSGLNLNNNHPEESLRSFNSTERIVEPVSLIDKDNDNRKQTSKAQSSKIVKNKLKYFEDSKQSESLSPSRKKKKVDKEESLSPSKKKKKVDKEESLSPSSNKKKVDKEESLSPSRKKKKVDKEGSLSPSRKKKKVDKEESLSPSRKKKKVDKEDFLSLMELVKEFHQNAELSPENKLKSKGDRKNSLSLFKSNDVSYRNSDLSLVKKLKSKTDGRNLLSPKITDYIILGSSSEEDCPTSDVKMIDNVIRLSSGSKAEVLNVRVKEEVESPTRAVEGNSVSMMSASEGLNDGFGGMLQCNIESDDDCSSIIEQKVITVSDDEETLGYSRSKKHLNVTLSKSSVLPRESTSGYNDDIYEFIDDEKTAVKNVLKRSFKSAKDMERVVDCTIGHLEFSDDDFSDMSIDSDVDRTCFICKVRFTKGSNSNVYNHFISEHNGKSMKCGTCKKSFKTFKSIYFHAMNHKGVYPWKCKKCGESLKNKSFFKRHMNRVHRKVKMYSCDVCKESFSYHSSYLAHVSEHKLELKFVCVHCSKAYGYKQLLAHHQENVRCEECDLNFPCKTTFQNHSDDVHPLDLLFRCSQCCLEFKSQRILRFHVTSKHLNEVYKNLIYCKNCNYCTQSRYNLNRHIKNHH